MTMQKLDTTQSPHTKAQKTVLRNRLEGLLLKYTKEKDWSMVYLLIATIAMLMERGDI